MISWQICGKAVTMKQQGVSCDDCILWYMYHGKCRHMTTNMLNCLSDISWQCVRCRMPQFTSRLFDSIDMHTNSFCSLYPNHTSRYNLNVWPLIGRAFNLRLQTSQEHHHIIKLSHGTTLWFSIFRATKSLNFLRALTVTTPVSWLERRPSLTNLYTIQNY